MSFSIVNDYVISANELNYDLKVINPNKQATELYLYKNDPPLFFNGTVVLKTPDQMYKFLVHPHLD